MWLELSVATLWFCGTWAHWYYPPPPYYQPSPRYYNPLCPGPWNWQSGRDVCKPQCCLWAVAGQCEKNQAWMLPYCQESCGSKGCMAGQETSKACSSWTSVNDSSVCSTTTTTTTTAAPGKGINVYVLRLSALSPTPAPVPVPAGLTALLQALSNLPLLTAPAPTTAKPTILQLRNVPGVGMVLTPAQRRARRLRAQRALARGRAKARKAKTAAKKTRTIKT